MANTSTKYLSLVAGICLAILGGCGGGDSGGSGAVVQVPYEIQIARALQPAGLSKNPVISPLVTPFINEPIALAQIDLQALQNTSRFLLLNRYSVILSRLMQRGGIGRLDTRIASDLACSAAQAGGGIASDSVIVMDGKMLDTMADVANGLALRESGRSTLSISQVVDAAAAHQMSFMRLCGFSNPLAFPDGLLTTIESDRATEIFTQFFGGILFHEFGHVWNWHSLVQIREQLFVPGGGFFRYTSAIEDNADLISGILNAKSGHNPFYTKMAYDLMAFTYLYRRSPSAFSFNQVTAWESQYSRISNTHSSLAVRKSLVDGGFFAWQQR